MSNANHARHNVRPQTKSKNKWLLTLGASAAAFLLLAGGIWFFGGDRTNDDTDGSVTTGLPLPMANTPQTVLGLQVNEPAVDRGRLPLDSTVTQVYEIVNTGTGPAEFGEPTIEVLDGCCPPQIQMTQMMLGPGQMANVGFSTQMHEGMDGPHLFHITVPVRTGDEEDALHLYFKGDFRG